MGLNRFLKIEAAVKMEPDVPGRIFAEELQAIIKAKCTPGDVKELLRRVPNSSAGEDEERATNPLAVDVFIQTILNLGSKTITHTFSAIAKFYPVFQHLGSSESGQTNILQSVYGLWQDHQQMIAVVVTKLLRIQVLDCSTVANWIFSTEMRKDFTRFYVWDILHACIKKMNRQVVKLQKELDEARDKKDAADNKAQDGLETDIDAPTEDDIEQMEEKLENAQGEQKNLFLIIFQRFLIMLSNHIASSEAHSQQVNTLWFKWTVDRLRQVFLQHHEQVFKYKSTLDTLLFTSEIDSHILDVFHEFLSLRG